MRVALLVVGLLGLGTTWLVADGAASMAAIGQVKAQAKPEAKPTPATDDRARLQGNWRVVSVLKDGAPSLDGQPNYAAIYFADDFIFVKHGESYKAHKYEIDPGKEPKEIDLIPHPDDPIQNVRRGIYHLEGADLELCFDALPGVGKRPTRFASKPGSHLLHLALKRDPKAEKPDVEKLKNDFPLVAAKERSIKNLSQIALAMHLYTNDNNLLLPPAAICDKNGKPLLSWRVALLPYLEQDALYKQFKLDEPWNSEHNKKLSETLLKVYAPVTGRDQTKPVTYYRVFTGKEAGFRGCEAVSLRDFAKDGTSNTILVVEAGEAVPWTKPDELPYDPKKPLPKLGGLFPDVFHIVMADRVVRAVKVRFNEKVFRDMITPDGGEAVFLSELDK